MRRRLQKRGPCNRLQPIDPQTTKPRNVRTHDPRPVQLPQAPHEDPFLRIGRPRLRSGDRRNNQTDEMSRKYDRFKKANEKALEITEDPATLHYLGTKLIR